jgi:hypothetical protein
MAEDLLAYVAGVAAHPAYTDGFVDELTTPGIRIPMTTDATLFQRRDRPRPQGHLATHLW